MDQTLKYEKEQRELARLKREGNKPKFSGYLFMFLFVIAMVYMTDEISTNIGKFLELDVASYFFRNVTTESASATRALVSTIITVIAGVSMFLRPLADRFGRKLFLVIYTLGMGVAMLLIGVTTGVPGWVIGTLLIQMCIPHDMQQVYIQECTPKDKRGTYFFGIKGFATLSLMLVPLIKLVLPIETSETNFKVVYTIIGCVGLASGILAGILMRESDVYIDSRIHYLTLTQKERDELKAKKADEAKKGGIISGLIYIFKNKQLTFLVLSMCLIMFTYVLTDNYSTIMGCGWLKANNLPTTVDNYSLPGVKDLATNAVLVYPIGCGLIVLLPGFISDKIGRKKSAIIFGILALVLYVLFYIGSLMVWNPYILGLLIGGACGAIWSCGDLILLMVTESSTTNMRVSANACALFLPGIIYMIGQTLVSSISVALGRDELLGLITIIIVIFGLVIGLVLLSFTVKETKGTDLNNIKNK